MNEQSPKKEISRLHQSLLGNFIETTCQYGIELAFGSVTVLPGITVLAVGRAPATGIGLICKSPNQSLGYRYGPGCVRDNKDLKDALALLAEHGRARLEEDGRRRFVVMNPALYRRPIG